LLVSTFAVDGCTLEIPRISSHITAVAMKFLSLLFLLAAFTSPAQTNHTPWCCRFPLRVMGGGGVNLTPLGQWWVQHGGQNEGQPAAAGDYIDVRPLAAWKRVTGEKTGELEDAWVVKAEIYTSPASKTNEWILLRHPPAAEEQQYYYLQSLLVQDTQQIATDAQTHDADEKAAKKEEARAKEENTSYSKGVRFYAADYEARAAQYRNAAAAALAEEKQYQQGREQALQQFNALPSMHGRYKLDVFALELGRNSKGQLVFDAGQIYQAAP
jgi:hypothetical protein